MIDRELIIDREKVIKALEECAHSAECGKCPYGEMGLCEFDLMADAAVLLAEQEPVKPIAEGKRPYRWFRCGNCEEPLYGPWNYCQKCGKKVDWNE